jgi:acetyltransferase-like isoleucine patch superfamily enzyme
MVSHFLYWSRRFRHFGWGSLLYPCDLLHKPKAISIGRNVKIMKGARLEAVGKWDGRSPKIVIGDGTSIQLYFHCGAAQSVRIGNDVMIAGRVLITDHDHTVDHPQLPPLKCRELNSSPVVIEDGAWLGEGCVILKGVTVGRRAVVGANAVVTKDVAPFTIVGGVPAREIRKIKVESASCETP